MPGEINATRAGQSVRVPGEPSRDILQQQEKNLFAPFLSETSDKFIPQKITFVYQNQQQPKANDAERLKPPPVTPT